MRCPFCDADKESLKVIDSRACEGGRAIRRRRECVKCSKRFTTYERVEQQMKLTVVKKDGRRMPWNRASILNGLERACFKLSVPESELLRIVDEVEEEVFATYDREVPSSAIGQLVIDHLRRVDKVAYVRFASMYRARALSQFLTLWRAAFISPRNSQFCSRLSISKSHASLFLGVRAITSTRLHGS